MYYVNERWLGGMLTNFKTIQSRIKRQMCIRDRANMADEQHMTEDETVMWIREHIDEIEDVSRRCVAEENYDYPCLLYTSRCV